MTNNIKPKDFKQITAFLRLCLMVLLATGFTFCANEKAPEGGKKDTTPPKPRKISPPNKTLNFTAKQIEITFDEYIKASGFAQTLISPPMDKRPEFTISGKTLVIKLKSPLRDSTTYTINFAEDIKDVNEGNVLNNFSYVFSTGAFIDSQKVAGRVIMAKDNSPADGVIVSLYPEDSMNAIKRSKPYYFAKTDKSGNFKIGNIRAANYRIFALKDQNYDYLYNQPNEMIGFSDTIWSLKDSTTPKVELYLFSEYTGKFAVAGTKMVTTGNVQVYFTKPYKSLSITSDPPQIKDFWYANATKDTINYWYSNYYDKKIKLFLVANDTIHDSARIELKFIPKDSLPGNPKYGLSVVNQSVKQDSTKRIREKDNTQELYKPVKLTFSRPLMEINLSKAFRLVEDSAKKEVIAKFEIDEKTKMSLNINFNKEENTSYTLEVPDSVVSDIFGVWNKKFTYKFKTNSKDNYGNINLTLKNAHPEKHYIIKLLNDMGEVVKEIQFGGEAQQKIAIQNLPSGNYKFTAVDDTNNSGQWDTGNFKEKIQPEKVLTFKDSYALKGGWDLDAEISL